VNSARDFSVRAAIHNVATAEIDQATLHPGASGSGDLHYAHLDLIIQRRSSS
jgi:hypothetical protein